MNLLYPERLAHRLPLSSFLLGYLFWLLVHTAHVLFTSNTEV